MNFLNSKKKKWNNQGFQIIENHKRRCVNLKKFNYFFINLSFQITEGLEKCPQKVLKSSEVTEIFRPMLRK